MIAPAIVSATAVIVARLATQRMTGNRGRIEAETKRRHQVEDLQHATLVNRQDTLTELLNATQAVTSIVILEKMTTSRMAAPYVLIQPEVVAVSRRAVALVSNER
jgi:hypothetical protein